MKRKSFKKKYIKVQIKLLCGSAKSSIIPNNPSYYYVNRNFSTLRKQRVSAEFAAALHRVCYRFPVCRHVRPRRPPTMLPFLRRSIGVIKFIAPKHIIPDTPPPTKYDTLPQVTTRFFVIKIANFNNSLSFGDTLHKHTDII